ncbi:MAG TPA: DUF2442 domain-containing protein [Gemmatimonadales bacterium]|nr:DUF2442 domain-containing protein [Gemmatimonadales bacterium]
MFASHRDPAFFAQVRVDPESGTIAWPNDTDLDPDVLYEAAHGLHTLGVDSEPGSEGREERR